MDTGFDLKDSKFWISNYIFFKSLHHFSKLYQGWHSYWLSHTHYEITALFSLILFSCICMCIFLCALPTKFGTKNVMRMWRIFNYRVVETMKWLDRFTVYLTLDIIIWSFILVFSSLFNVKRLLRGTIQLLFTSKWSRERDVL